MPTRKPLPAEDAPTADNLDQVIPPLSLPKVPIVGLGGSAGAVKALQDFFGLMPEKSGLAFVVILHLSPDHESLMPELLRKKTAMPVVAVKDRVLVEPDHVYVISPNVQLSMSDGHIVCAPLQETPGKRVAVDIFFRTLADSHGPRAISIILSGADCDGSIGIKRIKEHGGLTIAQEPTEAEHDSMPRSAIATGMIDWVLPIAQMPERLAAHQRNEQRMQLPEEVPHQPLGDDGREQETLLRDILALLKARTGHDFSHYKRATVLRRIGRRLQVNNLENLEQYLEFTRTHAEESSAFLKDLLISVTNFFRDREVFEALRPLLPRLYKNKEEGEAIRVWVAACATGEEAYSIAMLLHEYSSRHDLHHPIQIFATDIDDDAIAAAREGTYPETIEADVSQERLRRFFTHELGRYRVQKPLRESILFASHNLLKNAPFSRLDLVTCRNLLIYLNRNAQEAAFDLFHFALRADGILLLGSSETADDSSQLFSPLDKKHRLYARRAAPRSSLPLPLPLAAPIAPAMPVMPLLQAPLAPPPLLALPRIARNENFGALHLGLLEEFAPPSVVVNSDGEIMHLSPSAYQFLHFPGGEPSTNLLKVVHPDLSVELRAALFRAGQERSPQVRPVAVQRDGQTRLVNLHVRPAGEENAPYFLVIFGEQDEAEGVLASPPATREEAEVAARLAEEVQHLKNQLRATVENCDASTEELQASNEELQAINEELRSTTEEFETSKEELQSVNEELTTVNQELKSSVDELSHANADLRNLLASTDIATVFLDRHFYVRRFTPRAAQIFNILPNDINRSLFDLTHRLEYSALQADATRVLETLSSIEREVSTLDGHHLLMRILPYRSAEDKIDGVVLTFTDITIRKQTEIALRESEVKYRTLFDSIDEGFSLAEVIQDEAGTVTDFRFREVNAACERLTGLSNIVGKLISEVMPQVESHWMEQFDNVVQTGEPARIENYNADTKKWYQASHTRIGEAGSRLVGTVFDEITERKRREANLAFLAEVSQDLVSLTRVDEMMNQLGAKIGGHFNVARCIFAEVLKLENHASYWEWHRPELFKTSGEADYSQFINEEYIRRSRAGETIVVPDVYQSPLVNGRALEDFFATTSFVTVPLLRDGQWRFTLGIYDFAPRDWQADEIELMEELTARIWTRLERARAEESLRESQNQLRLALDAAELGTFQWYPPEDRTELDARMLRLFGLREGETLNRAAAFAKIVHPDDRESLAAAIAVALDPNGDGKLDADYRVVHPDNSLHWLHSQGQTFFGGETPQRALLMYGMVLDITERKRREANLAFLAETSADFAPLLRAEEIMERIGKRLADHLALSRCNFSVVDEESDLIECLYAWRRDDSMTDLFGAHNISTFLSEEGRRHYAAGNLAVINDTRNSPLLNKAQFELFDDLSLRSIVDAPYLQDGRWKFLLTVARPESGQWHEEEIELVQELAERIYIRIERAHAEEAVRESEERYRTLFDSIDEGYCTIEVLFDAAQKAIDYRFMDVNPAFGRQTGIENAAGKTMREIAPEHEEFWFETYGRIAQTGEAVRFEHESAALDSFYDVYAFHIGEPHENKVGVLFNNIKGRKQAEAAVRESEARFRTLSDVVPQVIWTNEAGGGGDYFNSRWFEYSGLSLDESFGLGWQAIVHPDDAPASKARWQEALDKGEIFDTEYRLRGRDGAYRWFIGRNVPLRDEARRVTGWFGTATDIEDLKQAEAALRDSEERLRLLVESVTDYAIITIDSKCHISSWNPGAETIFGWSESEAIGQSTEIIFTPEDIANGAVRQETGEALRIGRASDERWHIRKDGSRFYASGVLARLGEADEKLGYVKIARDLTSQKQMEDELQCAHDELEKRVAQRTSQLRSTNKALEGEMLERKSLEAARLQLLGRLVSTQEDERKRIARELHDEMGQHLTALLMGLKALPDIPDAGLSPPSYNERIEHLQQLANEMMDQINGLAWALRPAALDNVGLEAALRQLVEQWSRACEIKAEFQCRGLKGGKRLPPHLETTIYRIVQEALTNVQRHSKAQNVTVLLERAGKRVIAVVEDDGQGFDDKMSGKNAEGKAKERLGLLGMTERAEMVGGVLTVESARNKGTTVQTRLPLDSREAATSEKLVNEPGA